MQYLQITAATLNLKSTLTGSRDRRAFCDFVVWVLDDKQFGVQQYIPKAHQKAFGDAVSLFRRFKDDPGVAAEIGSKYAFITLVSGNPAQSAYCAGRTLMSCADYCLPVSQGATGPRNLVMPHQLGILSQAALAHEEGLTDKKGTVGEIAFMAKAREKMQSIIAEHTPPALAPPPLPEMDF